MGSEKELEGVNKMSMGEIRKASRNEEWFEASRDGYEAGVRKWLGGGVKHGVVGDCEGAQGRDNFQNKWVKDFSTMLIGFYHLRKI